MYFDFRKNDGLFYLYSKRINAANFDISIDQEKYKALYLKVIKAYVPLCQTTCRAHNLIN
jgi:hypothetical protein